MYRLYHYPLCPFSRKVRVVMAEQGVEFKPIIELFWERRGKFVRLNPMMTVPFVIRAPNLMLSGSQPIVEMLEETSPQSTSLLHGSPEQRAEIRRIVTWFDEKFFREVSEYILYERLFNFFRARTEPNQDIIKVARHNLVYHMKYLNFLLSKRDLLAGETISLADITAACHLSSLDYLDEIDWQTYPAVKEWYSVIKSRPSFNDILQDNISGFKASPHYRELDF